jgi:flagellar hook-associated protein 3 FlgL
MAGGWVKVFAMNSRVSLQSIVQSALADTGRLSAQLATLQAQAATGKKFANISDDPTTALTVLDNNTLSQTYDAHMANIDSATSSLNASVSVLQQVSDLFSQAKSIAIDASSSVNDSSAFAADAQSVDALLSRLLDLANTQNPDSTYMFAGNATKTKPFAVTSTDAQGNPADIQYQGSADATSTIVDSSRQASVDYSGSQVFQQMQRQTATFSGNTGAAPGTGTDSAVGRGQLLLQHTATTYAAGSGVQPGTNSAAGDTILGPLGQHQLQIIDTSGNGSAGTVSLDGGPAVAFSNTDTNLVITNASGDVVNIDTTAITAGFNGNVNITSNGTMSIDGGATSTPITFTANQAVTDGATGQVTNVNTTGVTRTGVEAVNHPGTYDAFQAIMALRDDLRNTRQLSSQDQINAISADIAEIDRAHTNVLTTVGAQSATLQSLQSLQSNLQDLQLNAQKTASNLGDVDMTDLVVKLQAYQNMLQLSLGTFSRIVDQNLLNFLGPTTGTG